MSDQRPCPARVTQNIRAIIVKGDVPAASSSTGEKRVQMIVFKACTRRQSDVHVKDDQYGKYFHCMSMRRYYRGTRSH